MKISKIYSNKQFKNVEFSFEFNVVIGKISDINNDKIDTHNLGKTKLLEIIDFILLKGIDNKKKYFLTRNTIFTEQIFFGEFLLNNGKYLIIKRSVAENTKIGFKINEFRLNNFKTDIDNWDYENVAIKKAKDLLNNILEFDVLPRWNYRKSLNYFLRTQNDFLDVFKLGKFQGIHKDWKPMVFDLLNFNGELLNSKYEIEESLEQTKGTIKTLKEENKVDTTKRDKIVGLIDIKTDEKIKVEQEIDKFNFFTNDLKQKDVLVNNLDTQIQALNARHYTIKHEIKKINEALNNAVDNVNLDELKKLFHQTNIYFPENLSKQYSQLIEFNTQITKERNKYLSENLHELNIEEEQVKQELKIIESKKSEIINFLTEKDSYSKFKKYQKNLSKIEADILLLEEKLRIIDVILIHENTLSEHIKNQKQKINEINQELAKQNHSIIRKLFNEIIYDLLNVPAILSVSQNKEGNIEYEADYQTPINLTITDEAKGTTYKKILCSAFDIALLKFYNKKSFYRFVYHDGILDGLDIRIKKKHIALIRDIVKQFNIQYIFTVIESELYDNEGKIEFADDEICLMLSDSSDNDKLFEVGF